MNPASQTTARVVQPKLQPPLQQLEEVSSHCTGFTTKVKHWFSSHFIECIPFGYQDELGFHYDIPSKPVAD